MLSPLFLILDLKMRSILCISLVHSKKCTNEKRVYNHVLTKYKRLGPFSNQKSEKGVGDMHLHTPGPDDPELVLETPSALQTPSFRPTQQSNFYIFSLFLSLLFFLGPSEESQTRGGG